MKSVQNTSLSFGLFNAPVKIFAAGSSEKEVKFNYCGPEGEPVEQVYRIKDTGEVVTRDNLRKSFDGHMIDKTELENIEAASVVDEDGNDLKQIRIEYFVPAKDIPWERVNGQYYIGPNPKAGTPEALMTLIEGMKKRKVAAIAKVVLRSRQKCFALFVKDDILHAVCLTFKADVNLREDSELRADVKVQKPVLDMMNQLIETATVDAEKIDAMEDTFVERKRKLAEAAATGEKIEVTAVKENAGADLLSQLEASVKVAKEKVAA